MFQRLFDCTRFLSNACAKFGLGFDADEKESCKVCPLSLYRSSRSVRDLRDPRSPRPEEGHEAPRALPAAEEAPLAAPRFPRGLPQATGVPGNPRRSVDDGDDEEWRAGQQGARLLGLEVMVSKN